ncbi:hypothetical protein ACQ3G6_13010 [Allorhizobium undicola]|uniref:hypothetical protein n=1 Tax=Allorhizobium undicola TaxID=78527 RepID=UPI003D32B966
MARTRRTSTKQIAIPAETREDDFWASNEPAEDDPFSEPSRRDPDDPFPDPFERKPDDPDAFDERDGQYQPLTFNNGEFGDDDIDWGSDEELQEPASKRQVEDEDVRQQFAAALEKLRNPDPLIGSATVQMLSKIGPTRLAEQIAAAACIDSVKAEVADCELLAAEYKPAMIACGRAIKIGLGATANYRLGLGVSMDGGLHFLSAGDFDPFFIPEPPKAVADIAGYFDLLATTIAGLQTELKDHETVELRSESSLPHKYGLLKKALARGRAFFRRDAR